MQKCRSQNEIGCKLHEEEQEKKIHCVHNLPTTSFVCSHRPREILLVIIDSFPFPGFSSFCSSFMSAGHTFLPSFCVSALPGTPRLPSPSTTRLGRQKKEKEHPSSMDPSVTTNSAPRRKQCFIIPAITIETRRNRRNSQTYSGTRGGAGVGQSLCYSVVCRTLCPIEKQWSATDNYTVLRGTRV